MFREEAKTVEESLTAVEKLDQEPQTLEALQAKQYELKKATQALQRITGMHERLHTMLSQELGKNNSGKVLKALHDLQVLQAFLHNIQQLKAIAQHQIKDIKAKQTPELKEHEQVHQAIHQELTEQYRHSFGRKPMRKGILVSLFLGLITSISQGCTAAQLQTAKTTAESTWEGTHVDEYFQERFKELGAPPETILKLKQAGLDKDDLIATALEICNREITAADIHLVRTLIELGFSQSETITFLEKRASQDLLKKAIRIGFKKDELNTLAKYLYLTPPFPVEALEQLLKYKTQLNASIEQIIATKQAGGLPEPEFLKYSQEVLGKLQYHYNSVEVYRTLFDLYKLKGKGSREEYAQYTADFAKAIGQTWGPYLNFTLKAVKTLREKGYKDTPETLQKIRDIISFYPSTNSLVELLDAGITPEMLKNLRELGLESDEAVICALNYQGKTAEEIQQYKTNALTHLGMTRFHRITPQALDTAIQNAINTGIRQGNTGKLPQASIGNNAALILLPREDRSNAFAIPQATELYTQIIHNPERIGADLTLVFEIETEDEMYNLIEQIGKRVGKITFLAIAGHGNKTTTVFGDLDPRLGNLTRGETYHLGLEDLEDITSRGLHQYLSETAIIWSLSCSTGEGIQNLAKMLNQAFQRKTIASKLPFNLSEITMEYANNKLSRIIIRDSENTLVLERP